MDFWIILLVLLAGLVSGFINTIAGSGSLITLPLLMFLGLPAGVANGTNRISILAQSVVGAKSFKNKNVLDLKKGLWLGIPAVIGSIVGALIAIDMNEEIMRKCIGGLLIVMFFLIMYKPEKWVSGQAGLAHAKPGILQIIIFFAIGLYGGFIQAGVGFFLLAGLVLGAGFDLVKANAIKVLIVLLYTPVALGVFIWNSQVNYLLGSILAIGSMFGAWIAVKYAVSWGANTIRYFVLITILVSAIKLLGIVELVENIL